MPSRRAISEVIAALMLTLIVVSAAVMLYVYSSGLMGRLQGTSTRQPYLERVVLDYYDWTTISTLKLTVRNVGVRTVTLSDFFIAGRSNTTNITFGSGCNSPNGVLTVQSAPCVITFPVPSGLQITSGYTYSVRLVTKDGAIFSYSCIAGQTS